MSNSFAIMRTVDEEEWKRGLIHRDTSLSWASQLPHLPDAHIQKAFTSFANERTFLQAYEAVQQFVAGARRLGKTVRENSSLLDFGCGWGRITQAAYRYFDPAHIISADVQQNALTICRRTGLKSRLLLVDNDRPLDLADKSLDFIFAYSVFSHLNETLQEKWLREFNRVLVKGGVLAATTRAENMIKHVMVLAGKNHGELTPHQAKLVAAFSDPSEMLADLARGKFVFRAFQVQPDALGAGYGEAFVPERYVSEKWNDLFPDYIYQQPSGSVDQAVIVARKSA